MTKHEIAELLAEYHVERFPDLRDTDDGTTMWDREYKRVMRLPKARLESMAEIITAPNS